MSSLAVQWKLAYLKAKSFDGLTTVQNVPAISGGFTSGGKFYLSSASSGLIYLDAESCAPLARELARIFLDPTHEQ